MKKKSNRPTKKARKVARIYPEGLRFPTLEGTRHAVYPVPLAAEVSFSSVRSVNRWRRTGRIPPRPLLLLQLHHAGQLVPTAWRKAGVAFNAAGELVTGAYSFTLGQLEGYALVCAALRQHQRDREQAPAPQRPLLVVLPGGLA